MTDTSTPSTPRPDRVDLQGGWFVRWHGPLRLTATIRGPGGQSNLIHMHGDDADAFVAALQSGAPAQGEPVAWRARPHTASPWHLFGHRETGANWAFNEPLYTVHHPIGEAAPHPRSHPMTADDTLEFDHDALATSVHPILGPNYEAGRVVAERFSAQFTEEHFKPMLDEFIREVSDELHGNIIDGLIADIESGLQQTVWRLVDGSVEALLSGKPWALNQYVIENKWGDGERIREAVAKLIPSELQNCYINDLELKIRELNKEIQGLKKEY